MPQYNRQTYKYQAGALKGFTLLDDAGKAIARIDDVSKAIDVSGDLSRARFFKVGDEIFDISTPRGRQIFMQSMRTLDPAVQAKLAEGMPSLNFRGGTTGLGESPTIQGSQIPMSNRSVPDFTSQGSALSQGISQVPIRDVTPVVGSAQPLAFTPNLNPAFVAPSAAAGLTVVPFDALSQLRTTIDTAALNQQPRLEPGYRPDSTALDSAATATPQADSTTRQIAEQGSTADPGMLESEGFLNFMYDLFGPYADVFLSTDFGKGLGSVILGALGNRFHRGLTYKKGIDINKINKIRLNNNLPPITLKDFEAALTTPGRKVGLRDVYSMLGLRDKDLGRLTQGKGVMEGGYNRIVNMIPNMFSRPFGPFFRPLNTIAKVSTDTPVMSSQVAKQTAGRTRGKAGAVSEVKVENEIIPVGTNFFGSEDFKELFPLIDVDEGAMTYRLGNILGEEFKYINSDIADDAGKIDFDKAQKFSFIDPKSFTMDAGNSRLMGANEFKDGSKTFVFKVDDVIQNPDGDNIPAFFKIFINSEGKVRTVNLQQQVTFSDFQGPRTFNPRRNRTNNYLNIASGGRNRIFSGIPEEGDIPRTVFSAEAFPLFENKARMKDIVGGKKNFRERQLDIFKENFSSYMDENQLKNLREIGNVIKNKFSDLDDPTIEFYLNKFDAPKLRLRGGFPATQYYKFGGTAGEIRQMMDGYYPEIGYPVEDMFAVPLLV